MGVLIKNMKMPENCAACLFCEMAEDLISTSWPPKYEKISNTFYCKFQDDGTYMMDWKEIKSGRRDDCPLSSTWRSVKDELPEDGKAVLVWDNYDGLFLARYRHDGDYWYAYDKPYPLIIRAWKYVEPYEER